MFCESCSRMLIEIYYFSGILACSQAKAIEFLASKYLSFKILNLNSLTFLTVMKNHLFFMKMERQSNFRQKHLGLMSLQTISQVPGLLTLGNLRTTTKFTTTTSVDWEKTGTRTSVSAGKRKLIRCSRSVGDSTMFGVVDDTTPTSLTRRRNLLVALAQYTVTHFRSSSTKPSSWFLSSLLSFSCNAKTKQVFCLF